MLYALLLGTRFSLKVAGFIPKVVLSLQQKEMDGGRVCTGDGVVWMDRERRRKRGRERD